MTTLPAGGVLRKDPAGKNVVWFDWTQYLANLVSVQTIATPTFTVTGDDALLTTDQIVAVDANRQAQVRILGGTLGKRYQLTSHIVTNGVPPEEEDWSITVLVENQ
jgi:hypothetical protein